MDSIGRYLLICLSLFGTVGSVDRDASYKESFQLTFSSNATQPYVKLATIPAELPELTLCFWIRTRNETSRTVFSYAMPKRDNEIMVAVATSLDGKGFVTFHRQTQNAHQEKGKIIKDITKPEDIATHTSTKTFKGKWQHICIQWSAWSGICRIFIDGQMSQEKTGVALNQPVAPEGSVVLGQDQDVYGGAFEESDGLRADLTEFHLWDYELSTNNIKKLATCQVTAKGNIIDWSKMKMLIYNGVKISPTKITCS